jgi:hypothetical protein
LSMSLRLSFNHSATSSSSLWNSIPVPNCINAFAWTK